MNQIIDNILAELDRTGNLRRFPAENPASKTVDLSSNDYLGIASKPELQQEFLSTIDFSHMQFTSSASRLLSRSQYSYRLLEETLADAYGNGKQALLFNSGYHANTGIVSAFAGTKTYILADKLVHASIIDGIKLSGLPFARFRHNDYGHLDRLATIAYGEGYKLIIIAESVYSMDGDCADIGTLVSIKKRFPGSVLYVDEAHGVGTEGPGGLGLCKASDGFEDVDIIIGTLGKALASSGAFAITFRAMRSFLINRSRSLIFSTAIAPVNVLWSRFTFMRALGMDTERRHLKMLGQALAEVLKSVGANSHTGHIQPLIVGNPQQAVELSGKLREEGFDVLPIRTPTVPPGTDRLRFSLSAALSLEDISRLGNALRRII